MKKNCKLKTPFPLERLNSLQLGSMDGHRDSLVERGFIITRSIKSFLNDKHAIIIGPFGSGKSAIFNLLKNKSPSLPIYTDDLIVSIDEQVQFHELREDAATIFTSLSEALTYQLLWKFQVCRRIAEEIAILDGFPNSPEEKYLSEFISRTGGQGGHLSILSRMKDLLKNISIRIKTNLSNSPIDVEIQKDPAKTIKNIELNLDKVISNISKIITQRNIRQCTVIIDKLDKFVAGEDYSTQKKYIEALIQLEDDLYSIKYIGFKIFIRSDLYDRLDFSSLGPDKAEDNTLRLDWSKEEIRSFVAKRLYIALAEAGIWSLQEIIESSDLSDYSLRWYERQLLADEKSSIKYKVAHLYNKAFGRKRNKRTLFEKLDLAIINKLFDPDLVHEGFDGKPKDIDCQDFFDSHFLDGNNICTPRYMLVFLKELLDETNTYYLQSPNIRIAPVLFNGEWIYKLFPSAIVYKSYIQSKEKFIRHVSKVDERWSVYISALLEKSAGKTTIDYKWIRNNIQFDSNQDEQSLHFIIYLKVIGFLKVKKYDVDIKKRNFELPILYRKAIGTVKYTA